jgi:hypothetical protein
MLKLLRKDLILNWRALATTYALWSALWLGYPALRPGGDTSFNAWAVMVSLACAFLPVMLLVREDKFKAGALACSLPARREDIVVSHYVAAWLVAVAGAAVAVGVMSVLSIAGMSELAPPTARIPIVSAATIGVVVAVFLPFTLRFGIAGLIGFLILAQLVGIAALLASAMFGGAGGLRAAITAAASFLTSTRETLGPIAFSALILAAVLALNVASCRLSVLVYRTREF